MMSDIVINNAEDAKRLGKENIPFKTAAALVQEFEDFNPFHILPSDRARKYLDENWEGRMLDFQHFGIKLRRRTGPTPPVVKEG
jgi:hypothetical protein